MVRNRDSTRLIVSFIGNTDIKFFPPSPDGKDCSPILRLLLAMPKFEPYIPPSRTRLLLLDEDHRGKTERKEFCEKLKQGLPSLGLGQLQLVRHPVVLPAGPTDLNALYEAVWAAIPTYGAERADEIVFHISSGTPPMGFTLVLAAHCLPLDHWRLVETSREQNVQEVRLNYVLAARERRLIERSQQKLKLPDGARRVLLDDTVIDDPLVAASYAALHKAAANRKVPQRLLVRGPVGSGKWHACRQFARWRDKDTAHWLEPENVPGPPQDATLLIRHLDTWPERSLRRLTLLAAERPDIAIAATFRTDLPPVVPLAVLAREGLRGAAHIELPALGARSDVIALGEALARQLGILDGKLKKRLQTDLFTDVYPRNLHDLKSLLATAAVHSPGAHPEHGAYVRAGRIRDAEALLAEAWRIVSGMDFGPGRYRLDDVLDVIRAAIVRRARAEGRSQDEVGELLGVSQTTVGEILKRRLDLRVWQTPGESLDDRA